MARGAKPGERRGGRSKGTPNKRTEAVAERLEALGCDPIEGMARIAMDETVELSIRAQMYKELAQYVAPKRRAVEMQAEVGYSWIDAIRDSYKHDPPRQLSNGGGRRRTFAALEDQKHRSG
jgi:hypothetical protein